MLFVTFNIISAFLEIQSVCLLKFFTVELKGNLFIWFLCRLSFCHQIHADPLSYAHAIFFTLWATGVIKNLVGGKVKLEGIFDIFSCLRESLKFLSGGEILRFIFFPQKCNQALHDSDRKWDSMWNRRKHTKKLL